jgi:hypothetical protein
MRATLERIGTRFAKRLRDDVNGVTKKKKKTNRDTEYIVRANTFIRLPTADDTADDTADENRFL